nr:hypothetical protein OG409_07850 [Streptomyces sp. NBC_00974]
MSSFEFTDEDDDKVTCRPMHGGVPYILLKTDPNGCAVSLARVEEVVAGIRDMARQAGGQAEAGPCSAGLLPLDARAVEPCLTRGPHTMHRSASGESWSSPETDEL